MHQLFEGRAWIKTGKDSIVQRFKEIRYRMKDKSKLQPVQLQGRDSSTLERELYRIGATHAGPNVKVALATSRMIKGVLSNPNESVYLYLGKYDPSSDEIFLMADKSMQVAKDESISPTELTGVPAPLPLNNFDPMTASPTSFNQRMTAAGKAPRYGIDEKVLKTIKQMVNEILNKK